MVNEKCHACPRVLASAVFRYSDIPPLFRYSAVVPWCSGYAAGVPRSVVPCDGVPAFIVCPNYAGTCKAICSYNLMYNFLK